ncbi:hypothetical protein ACJX0J_033097 [Zea mays]
MQMDADYMWQWLTKHYLKLGEKTNHVSPCCFRKAHAYLSTSILNYVEAHGQTFVLMGDDSFVIIVTQLVEKYISIYILAQRRHFKPIHFRHFKGGTGLFCDKKKIQKWYATSNTKP